MKTAEDCIRDNCNVEYSKITGEEIVVSSLSAVCIAMEEYARQSSSLSDEEIETQAKIVFPFEKVTSTNTNRDAYNFPKQNGFCVGAKWARDRQKGGKP